MAYCWKAKLFGLFYSIRKTNLETATLKTLSFPTEWAYLKTCVCCHLCPKSGPTLLCCHISLESGLISENSPLLPPLSRKWAYFWKLTSVPTSVQKVGLYSENSALLPPLSRKWAYFWKLSFVATSVQKVNLFVKSRLCCHLCPKSGLISKNLPLLPPLSKKWP